MEAQRSDESRKRCDQCTVKTPAVTFLLVIPCYREIHRLHDFLEELCRSLAAASLGRTLVRVVDDGSPRSEQALLQERIDRLRGDLPLLMPLLKLPSNQGKGAAVRAGWDEGPSADWLGFVDADGAVPVAEVIRLMEMAAGSDGTADAFFGARVRLLGRRIHRRALRHYVGRVFSTLVTLILDIAPYDSQCGLKFLNSSFYRRVRPGLACSGFAMDVELINALLLAEAKIREIPIDWSHQSGSRIVFLRDSCRMAQSLFDIRRRRATWTFAKKDN